MPAPDYADRLRRVVEDITPRRLDLGDASATRPPRRRLVATRDHRLRERLAHNPDQIGVVAIPQGQPATLDHPMRDYVAHLEHHLRQIFRA